MVVTPAAPRLIAPVLLVPILTVPLVAPAPAFMTTFPPVPFVPVSAPPVKFRAAAAWLLFTFTPGCRDKEVLLNVVISGERFPARESCPVGERVITGVPLFCTCRALVALPVLLMTNAGADPWLVRVKEVEVESPPARVKAMFVPFDVVIVLPPLYAVCRVKVLLEQVTTSFEAFKQSPAPLSWFKPEMVRYEPLAYGTFIATFWLLPGLKVDAPLALSAPDIRSAPLLVVVEVPVPRLIPVALFVPILTVPFSVPVPASIKTEPPTAVLPVSFPPYRFNEEPVPLSIVFTPGWMVRELVLVTAAVVISGFCPPARVSCPPAVRVMFVWLICSVPVEVEYPITVFAFPAEDRVVAPVEERLVNAPVPGVVAPIAVLLIPEAVVVKLPEVMVRLLVPSPMVEALSPDRFNTPALAVRLRVPEERVNPFDAVRS